MPQRHRSPYPAEFRARLVWGSCGADALQAFWPQLETTYFSGFDCYANTYAFRPDNDQIYYFATLSGIRQNLDTDGNEVSAR